MSFVFVIERYIYDEAQSRQAMACIHHLHSDPTLKPGPSSSTDTAKRNLTRLEGAKKEDEEANEEVYKAWKEVKANLNLDNEEEELRQIRM